MEAGLALALVVLVLLLQAGANSSSPIGINYGQVGDDLPSPASVVPLLRSLGAARVRLYDADPSVLSALAGTCVELAVGLPDSLVPRLREPGAAAAWVRSALLPHVPAANVSLVTVGNEVLSGNDSALARALVPAMDALRAALDAAGLGGRVAVTTAHSLAVLASSFPPSSAAFRRELLPFVGPLLDFHARTRSPFLVNAYPYFAYKADPERVDIDYALFGPNPGVVDPGTGLRYENMLHAQVDAVRAAIARAGKEAGEVEVVVSETGWPSAGDEGEAGATPENAARYNGNLMRMVAEGRGTPAAPGRPLRAYVFALFNENLKPGPASERHYGLFNPDGTPAYDLDLALALRPSRNSTGAAAGWAESPLGPSSSSSTGYYTISSAMKERSCWKERMWALLATVVGLLLEFA
ncbi:Glucan endo-1,3-beta-glucosidase 11 [Ananas comosus]|uniref:glucan endo-1,3-beta-D-glucosidase n=1 Tax=Ananas comosus TaxID=4615 RepID=A0A199V8L6_ANACO|nr:Glucan endo-1,3-beta-glucosidase 11 [Ananas comosus]